MSCALPVRYIVCEFFCVCGLVLWVPVWWLLLLRPPGRICLRREASGSFEGNTEGMECLGLHWGWAWGVCVTSGIVRCERELGWIDISL